MAALTSNRHREWDFPVEHNRDDLLVEFIVATRGELFAQVIPTCTGIRTRIDVMVSQQPLFDSHPPGWCVLAPWPFLACPFSHESAHCPNNLVHINEVLERAKVVARTRGIRLQLDPRWTEIFTPCHDHCAEKQTAIQQLFTRSPDVTRTAQQCRRPDICWKWHAPMWGNGRQVCAHD